MFGDVTDISPYGLPHGGPLIEPDEIMLHYTNTHSAANAVNALGRRSMSGTEVSYHYIIDKDGTVVMPIKDSNVAYHAKLPRRQTSISISLVNLGNDSQWAGTSLSGSPKAPPLEEWVSFGGQRWEPYTIKQINVLKALITGLKARFPSIKYLSGHEEAQPEKLDPGPAFDDHYKRILNSTGFRTKGPIPTKNRNST